MGNDFHKLTRRTLLSSGLALSATSVLGMSGRANAQTTHTSEANPRDEANDSGSTFERERLLMDKEWRFSLGDADDPSRDFKFGELARERTFAKSGNIEQATHTFDDSQWSLVDLPHDWIHDLPFINRLGEVDSGAHPIGREFPATSIGWYRKTFKLPVEDNAKRIQIVLDGVYRDAMIFLNGHYLATNFSGYAPYTLDISDWLNDEEPNVLAIRVDATLGEGWFYEGAGIYRHVWLVKSHPIHLVEWGTFAWTEAKTDSAVIHLSSEVRNTTAREQFIHVSWDLIDPHDQVVTSVHSKSASIPPGDMFRFEDPAILRDPVVWSIEKPQMYKLTTTVHTPAEKTDRDTVRFGVRSLHLDANKGVSLNGKWIKIKGTCCHQDHSGVGAALPDRLQSYRIELLKGMGANSLRTSHNPPAPELMDATDSVGMLVLCETRMMDSSPEGLSQLERMIRRFRNHPSIFMWSLGNEEPEQSTERGRRIVETMQRLAHRLDPSRLCTVAINNKQQGQGVSRVTDVQGFNYSETRVDSFHREFPHIPIIGTETGSTFSTRGIYENDKVAGYVSAYDLNVPEWGNTAEDWWNFYDEREFLAGGFVWTGFDYRGEPTPYGWPCVSSHFGIMDLCGFPKDNYFYYKAWWGDDSVLHLFPHWNWPTIKRGEKISVWCHTNLEAVELFLNGQSHGMKAVRRNQHVEWSVQYQPGAIEVRGLSGGKIVSTAKRETVGEPAKIILSSDRPAIYANGEDIAMIRVEVQDTAGRPHPIASNEITFEVFGSAKLIGVGNGDPSSHESDYASSRRLFNGLAQAIVQSRREAGIISIRATSPGLASAEITLPAKQARLRPSI